MTFEGTFISLFVFIYLFIYLFIMYTNSRVEEVLVFNVAVV